MFSRKKGEGEDGEREDRQPETDAQNAAQNAAADAQPRGRERGPAPPRVRVPVRRTDAVRRVHGLPPGGPAPTDVENRLVVGRETVLRGHIASCERLVVEGRVDAESCSCGSMEIAATGDLKGIADAETADISGTFEGTLSVRGLLAVRATGRVSGSVSYGDLEIEQGGRICGEIKFEDPEAARAPLRAVDAPAG